MKFYNPFKPHIVTNGELFAIRKLSLFCFLFLDDQLCDKFKRNWWMQSSNQYFIGDLQNTKKLLNNYQKNHKWKPL